MRKSGSERQRHRETKREGESTKQTTSTYTERTGGELEQCRVVCRKEKAELKPVM